MPSALVASQYKDVILFLATAGVVVPLFRRWRVSPVLGFLAAGLALGPGGLGALGDRLGWLRYVTIGRPQDMAQLGEFGVVFLLFMIGLELSWERLRLMRRYVFGLGAAQVALSLVGIAAAGLALGLTPAAAAATGAALALSSTAVVIPILTERRRQHSTVGRAVFAVLLFQDLAVAPILVTLSVLAAGAALSPRLLLAFAPAAAGLVALVAFGRLLLRPMLRSVARAKSEEMFMAACLLVVIGAGLVSALAGLSMALGAFIAGLLLAETEYRHEVEVTIEPFKGLLLGLFFVSVGTGLDLSVVAERPRLVVGASAGLIAWKALTVLGAGRLFGLSGRQAGESALLLAGGGEFAFVILAAAMDGRIIDRATGEALLVAATLSMMCIPGLAALATRLGGRRPAEPGPTVEPAMTEGETPRVLVVGYGRVGKLVGEMLARHQIPWLSAERDPRLVEAGRRAGEAIFYGDASRPEFLVRCGLERALALVVTMDSPEGVEAVVGAAREMRADLTIVARARDARQAQRLYDLGATDAVPETVEASLQLSEAVLVEIGVPMGLVIASIHERRDEFRTALNRPQALAGRTRRARGKIGEI